MGPGSYRRRRAPPPRPGPARGPSRARPVLEVARRASRGAAGVAGRGPQGARLAPSVASSRRSRKRSSSTTSSILSRRSASPSARRSERSCSGRLRRAHNRRRAETPPDTQTNRPASWSRTRATPVSARSERSGHRFEPMRGCLAQCAPALSEEGTSASSADWITLSAGRRRAASRTHQAGGVPDAVHLNQGGTHAIEARHRDRQYRRARSRLRRRDRRSQGLHAVERAQRANRPRGRPQPYAGADLLRFHHSRERNGSR